LKHIRPSDWSDVWFLAGHLRSEDVEECAAHGQTALDALAIGLEKSHVCYTLLDPYGEAMGMAGVTPQGLVWLLGTPRIEKHPIYFLRHCRAVLERIYEESGCELLYNYTYCKNNLHHKWLKWMGFSFLRKVTLGPNGERFYEFARLRSHKQCVQ
jgi:hypothetical protein